jgi:hypothetical protein
MDPRTWRWVHNWLQAGRQHRARRDALRQCAWCANGLHGRCNGWTTTQSLHTVDCLCPCPTAAGLRTP